MLEKTKRKSVKFKASSGNGRWQDGLLCSKSQLMKWVYSVISRATWLLVILLNRRSQGEARKLMTFILSDEKTYISLVYFSRSLDLLILEVLLPPEGSQWSKEKSARLIISAVFLASQSATQVGINFNVTRFRARCVWIRSRNECIAIPKAGCISWSTIINCPSLRASDTSWFNQLSTWSWLKLTAWWQLHQLFQTSLSCSPIAPLTATWALH